jgi:GT2 family glycosyltransferase
LTSLFREIEKTELQVLVHLMDNSSNMDGIKELIETKYPQVKYVNSGGNIGFGKAQNIGFKKVEASFYLALNPDVEFIEGQNTLSRIIDYMKVNPEVGIVGPKTLNRDNSIQYTCNRYFDFFDQIVRRLGFAKKILYFKKKIDKYLMKDFDHEKTINVDWVIGSFMFLRGEVARELNFFDDRFFMYFEDCDLCRRMWHKGFRVVYLHDVIIKYTLNSIYPIYFYNIFRHIVKQLQQ